MYVLKNDGEEEPFNTQKIIRSIVAAGASRQDAAQVADQIEKWAETASDGGTIESFDIRDKVIELLSAVDPQASSNYAEFVKDAAGGFDEEEGFGDEYDDYDYDDVEEDVRE